MVELEVELAKFSNCLLKIRLSHSLAICLSSLYSPMADVRALLKAKRQEIQINHPLATYSQKTGQLRCTVCNTIVKHASAWEGHLGSKSHRTNVARIKEEERLQEAQRVQDEMATGKRKAEEEESPSPGSKRRKILDDDAAHPPAAQSSGAFPGDFFSDPSRAPLSPPPDDSEDDTEAAPVTKAMSALDLEWQKFQQTVLNPPDEREKYDRATVFAEPELASETPDGFPPQQPTDVAVDARIK
jgi:zinc finger protein 830